MPHAPIFLVGMDSLNLAHFCSHFILEQVANFSTNCISLVLLVVGLKDAELLLVCNGESDQGCQESVLDASLQLTCLLILAQGDSQGNQVLVSFAVMGVQLLVGGKVRLTFVHRALDLVHLDIARFACLIGLGGGETEQLADLDLARIAIWTSCIGLILHVLLLLSKLCCDQLVTLFHQLSQALLWLEQSLLDQVEFLVWRC